jgi:hypothetical protein
MSHALGVLCAEHRRVMVPDTCPECDEPHGCYTLAPCDERCPENRGYET